MKINTDGVLLGALADAKNLGQILDIGTGTGVIALMLAQRFHSAFIEAVEIDGLAAKTALINFSGSPFADRLAVASSSFEDFFKNNPDKKYDLIVSNPPFYINSLASPQAGKNLAKHAYAGFFETLLADAGEHLTTDGLLWLILPVDTAELVKSLAGTHHLSLRQIISIKSYPESKPHRQILVFGLNETTVARMEFVIYDAPKQYSGQYQTALQDFFTIFP